MLSRQIQQLAHASVGIVFSVLKGIGEIASEQACAAAQRHARCEQKAAHLAHQCGMLMGRHGTGSMQGLNIDLIHTLDGREAYV